MTPDPIGLEGGINLFAYVDSVGKPYETNLYTYTGNNPVNYVDPLGLTKKKSTIKYILSPCTPVEEQQCRTICASQGREYESCRATYRVMDIIKDGKPYRDIFQVPTSFSCSCKEPCDEKGGSSSGKKGPVSPLNPLRPLFPIPTPIPPIIDITP